MSSTPATRPAIRMGLARDFRGMRNYASAYPWFDGEWTDVKSSAEIGSDVGSGELGWRNNLPDRRCCAACVREKDRGGDAGDGDAVCPVSYTHLRAHETGRNLVC